MQYILIYQNISEIICWQTIAAWKNLRDQGGFLHLKDNLIGILSYQQPKHGIYGKF